jgi:hypothetical protein
MAASLAVFVRCFVDRVRSGEGRASFGRLAGLAQLGRRRGQRPVRRMGIWTLGRTHCRSDTHGRGRKARLVCSLADVYTRLHAPTCIYMHLHAPTRTYTHLHAPTYTYTHLAVRLASRFSSLRRAGRRGRAFGAWNRGPPC